MHRHRHPCQGTARRQRGGAALVITLLLFFAMTLIAGVANRNHLFELRASANQVRAAAAFEAAEAGIDWAIAMLNGMQPLDDDCTAASGGSSSFRERFLSAHSATGAQTPISRSSGPAAVPQQAACVRQGGRWACSCPAGAPPSLAVAGEIAPAFLVHFAPSPAAGTVRLLSTGCSAPAGPCLPGSAAEPDATARVEVTLGLLPGLASLPPAALTVLGSVHGGSASLGLHNPDVLSGGFTVQAGGAFAAPNARLTSAPGAPPLGSIVDNDAGLNALDGDRLFTTVFGLDKTLWLEQAAVVQLACNGECGAALARALASNARPRMVRVLGDAQLSAPLVLGTPDRPAILVVSGTLRLVGPVQVHGLVHAGAIEWNADGSAGAPLLRGAAVSEDGYRGDAAADLSRDAAVLARLKAETGSFVRVPGSWKDF